MAPRPERIDFDALALDLARGLSRRQALARLGGLLLGALVASLGMDRAWADVCQPGETLCGVGDIPVCCPAGQLCLDPITRTCGPCSMDSQCAAGQLCCDGVCQAPCDGQCCSGVCCGTTCFAAGSTCCTGVGACPPGQTCCQDQFCANLRNDERNCGACGFSCMSGQICSNGQCMTACPAGQTFCNGACVDTQSDRHNCGQCGTDCGADPSQPCCHGVCRSCTGAAVSGACCGSKGFACCQHGDGESCCDGACCPAGQHCSNGACQPGCVGNENCPISQFCVSGACLHCKGAGDVCDQNKECCSGHCRTSPLTGARFCAPCPDGQTLCGVSCANTQTDRFNCGQCGSICSGTCCSGVCCPPGTTCCSGACVDLTTDSNCGACGNACPDGSHCEIPPRGTPFCRCTSGQVPCGPAPGVCCPAGQQCRRSPLTGAHFCASCPEGQILCGNDCVNPQEDRKNCGACGHACAPAESCINGACCGQSKSCRGPGGAICCNADAGGQPCCGSQGAACCQDRQGQTCCDGICCPDGHHCERGACVPGCVSDANCSRTAEEVCCGGVCVIPMHDSHHCGRCGVVCTAPEICSGGHCCRPSGASCTLGITCCSGTCERPSLLQLGVCA